MVQLPLASSLRPLKPGSRDQRPCLVMLQIRNNYLMCIYYTIVCIYIYVCDYTYTISYIYIYTYIYICIYIYHLYIYSYIYIYINMVQCRPAPPPPPMVMGGQPCFLWFPPPPCGLWWCWVLEMLVMGGQSWFLWLAVCMWCM